MDQFIQFVMHNWELWLALVILVVLIIHQEMSTHVRGVHLASPQQVTFMLNQQQAMLIDIREKADYDKGHIIGAVYVSRHDIASELTKLTDDKTRQIVIYGASDQQAISAGVALRKHGFEHVHILKGGINAWLAANMLLTKN